MQSATEKNGKGCDKMASLGDALYRGDDGTISPKRASDVIARGKPVLEVKIQKESTPSKETGMPEIDMMLSSPLENVDMKMTQQEESTPLSTDVSLVKSESMNLLDESAQQLMGLMKGLTANRPDPAVLTIYPETARAAATLAKEITAIMKLKLDVVKEQRKWKLK